ncbi:conserved hypothetical protein [Burkholderia cepacia]|nr:conserved hypothetical protein [Burkholderia cepacia]
MMWLNQITDKYKCEWRDPQRSQSRPDPRFLAGSRAVEPGGECELSNASRGSYSGCVGRNGMGPPPIDA